MDSWLDALVQVGTAGLRTYGEIATANANAAAAAQKALDAERRDERAFERQMALLKANEGASSGNRFILYGIGALVLFFIVNQANR